MSTFQLLNRLKIAADHKTALLYVRLLQNSNVILVWETLINPDIS